MTYSLTRSALLSTAAILALGGCWEPKSHDGLRREDGARSGPWSTCEDALAAGASGDSCTFAGGCGVADDPATQVWDHASCTADGLLIRASVEDAAVDVTLAADVPHRLEDGCIGVQTASAIEAVRMHPDHSNTFGRTILCVPDELLGPVSAAESIDLDAAGACDSLLEDREPGAPCSGDSVCGLMLLSPPASGDGAQVDPLFAWCHAGRLRVAEGLQIFDTCPLVERWETESFSCTY